jgi:hypothetical protein
MTYLLSPNGIRTSLLGVQVNRATATLPQGTLGHIFTVTGGRIVVTSLVGEVTTIVGATVTTVKVTSTPTVGTAVDLASATAITSLEAGGHITLPLTLGGALVVNNAGAGQIPGALGFLVPAGSIDITTSANDTGSVKWSLTYIPYDDAATVAAGIRRHHAKGNQGRFVQLLGGRSSSRGDCRGGRAGAGGDSGA